MSANNLKRHTVKIGSGSGCVFQPMDDTSTYILTAKHLFQNENQETKQLEYVGDNTETSLTFLEYDGDSWDDATETFTVQLGENYFPHQNADAAILKISYRKGFENIHIRKKRLENYYWLCGFPGRLQHQDGIGNDYSSFMIANFKQSGNFFDVAKLNNDILTKQDIEGTSGGGIMTFDGLSNIFVTGIQSRMATDVDLPFGEVGFVPIKYFEEIVEEYYADGRLARLLPVFLKSFVSLIGETFQMGKAPLHKEEAALSGLLTAKAQLIRESDLTPLGLKSFMGDKRLLINYKDNIELRRKKVWTFWLELLVILNIAKDKVHNTADLKVLTQKIRFFYSNTDSYFLDEHLQDLWKIDYTNLEDGGLVVFTSNKQSQNPKTKGIHKLCDIVPDISSTARIEFTNMQNEALASGLIDIAEVREFPFDRFKYASISTFKEDAALALNENFVNMKPVDCYPLLKELYEGLLS
ncbi:MAG: ABC-three component system protein [Maribacter sp.]|uniref:ABC-three component system protein n=1 Tax=Maribacter sp. TaxID=1897614 RepID=UPI0032987936